MIAAGILIAIVVFFGVIRMLAGIFDRPTELDADIWVPDPEERAANLKAKTEAWRAGRPYVSRAELERWEANFEAARSQPWANEPVKAAPREERPRRLVRRHPMRPPRWE